MKPSQLLLLLACLAVGADAGAQLELKPTAAGYGMGRPTTFVQPAPLRVSKILTAPANEEGGTVVAAPGLVSPTQAFGLKLTGGEHVLFGAWNGTRLLRRARPARFDFARTQPHLAFFCRLEMDEARGGAIPMKFRLGGHRAWQEDLLRR